MKAKFTTMLWVFFSLFAASTGHAETGCAGLTDALAQLDAKYGEKLIWQGLYGDGARLLITSNPDGSTWTALIQGEGLTVCFAGSGESWAPGGGTPAPQGTEG